MMAYRPPYQLKGRIEVIRKKFEPVNDGTSFKGSAPNKDVNSPPDWKQQKIAPHLINSKPVFNSNKNDISPSHSKENGQVPFCERINHSQVNKGNIRRSPAFRCDRSSKAQAVISSSNEGKIQSVFETKVKIFEMEQKENSSVNKIKLVKNNDPTFEKAEVESLKEPNYLTRGKQSQNIKPRILYFQNDVSPVKQKPNLVSKPAVGEILNENHSSGAIAEKRVQCSEAFKQKDIALADVRQVELTNTLKAALKAPLPFGPPPKKPPRTFAHINSPTQSGEDRSVISGSEIVKEESESTKGNTEHHLMLKKLEEALLCRQNKGVTILTPRSPEFHQKVSHIVKESSPKNDIVEVVHEKPEEPSVFRNCLSSLNCASNGPQSIYSRVHVYDKTSRSQFFIGNQSKQEQRLYGSLHKAHSDEHIYAEPFFINNGKEIQCNNANNQKTCGKFGTLCEWQEPRASISKGLSSSAERLDVSPHSKSRCDSLHYMCSPITVKTDYPVSLPTEAVFNSESNNRPDGESGTLGRRCVPHLKLSALKKCVSPVLPDHHSKLLDRNKIQLMMNQAFGSPLEDITSIHNSEVLLSTPESIPNSPDEESVSTKPITEDETDIASKDDTSSVSSDLSRLTEERKVYVRRVSSRVCQVNRPSSGSDKFLHLFHCVLLVGLNLDCEKKTKVPYIKTKYPPHAEVPPLMEQLCFPDASYWPPLPTERAEEQAYSLVLTNESGVRTYGYCRRVLPEGASICLPLAYCIISPFRARGFYYKVLHELESRHGQPEWLQTAFIKELYACEFPAPGQGLKCTNINKFKGTGLVCSVAGNLQRPPDSRLEDHDVSCLFSALPIPVLLQTFSTLLLERKVLFFSKSLSKLSNCIEGLESILYPFSWQYTFIPVLPSFKLEICEAPTPYIIGVLKEKDGTIPSVRIDEGLVVDLDGGVVLQCVGDESSILPARLKRCLKVAFQLVTNTNQESARNVLVSEAFVRAFVEMCGHYQTHIVMQQDGRKVFERESFIKAIPSKYVQLFLEWFTETAMFSTFIKSCIERESSDKGMFEQRVAEHAEELEKNRMLFLRNYKVFNKKVKTLGDRLKDWAPFT